jgi:hypothetical protein
MADRRRASGACHWARYAVIAIALATSGCLASTRNPERLYAVPDEMAEVKREQEPLVASYYSLISNPPFDGATRARARSLRNEIVAQRMYAIDVLYTQYEAGLTRERQEVGFATLTTAEGLSTAATLVTPTVTKSILSGLTTAVVATKGHYESEILLAQTMRTIQKQMRASRHVIAEHITARMGQDIGDYPLAAALGDVEDYYRAGTLTTGVLDTSTTVGEQEKASEQRKQEIARLPAAARRAAILADTTTPIPAPVRLPVLNPEGQGFREQHLTPAVIRRLQRVVCMEENGRFSADFRARVLKYLAKIRQKDSQFPGVISSRDAAIMGDEFDAGERDCS